MKEVLNSKNDNKNSKKRGGGVIFLKSPGDLKQLHNGGG